MGREDFIIVARNGRLVARILPVEEAPVSMKRVRRPDSIPFDEADFSEACRAAGFVPLGLADKHVLAAGGLSRPRGAKRHSDPFGRTPIAQAKVEGMSLVTHDELIPGYGERCVIAV